MAIIVLLQKDLRLFDNPALFYAAQGNHPIIPVYLQETNLGSASKWWLASSLAIFRKELQSYGLPLLYHRGGMPELISQIKSITNIDDIYWNDLDREDENLKKIGKKFYPNLLFPPEKINRAFKLCAPLWNYCRKNLQIIEPLPKPQFKTHHSFREINDIKLPIITGPEWWKDMEKFWQVGEGAALKKFEHFKTNLIDSYKEKRDFPAIPNTSLISPHLHFGEISVRHIWNEVSKIPQTTGVVSFLNEIGWREFSYNLLFHNKNLQHEPLKANFKNFPWDLNEAHLKAWKTGRTGFPIIDAGMRQLWKYGWMHNRVRMIVASFLSKNLLIPWQIGEQWFFDCLVDADIAINSTNWQWVAGCGTDSAPYFRIFNPILQSKKFDPNGEYIKAMIPELANCSSEFIHDPHSSPPLFRPRAYPKPIVDLKVTRERALNAITYIHK
jgi:deoxyribodipyrimidine photo-lyase